METSSASAANSNPSGTTQNKKGLSGTFDQFLTLLTTQLKYQDPLEPLDGTQFTEQLVQFSSVEQAINQNAKLDKLISLQSNSQSAFAVSYIGKNVLADGATAPLSNDRAKWNYTLPKAALKTTLTIHDSKGNVVKTLPGATGVGAHSLEWNGANDKGDAVADGLYTLRVSAKGSNDEAISVDLDFKGRVTGFSQDGADIDLIVEGVTVPLGNVISVFESPRAGADKQAYPDT